MAGEGVFCHQCRQKTTRRVFLCNNMRGKNRCSVKICQPCLKNRYIKITTVEAAALDDWKCPKCCGTCNCSVCLKRQGKKPLGRLVPESEKTADKEPAEVSETIGEAENQDQMEDVKGKRKAKAAKEPRRVKAKEPELPLPLPLGVPLTTVAGIELHPQDVGHALQFVEFCEALEEVLEFSKAQAESLLGDLMRQPSGRPASIVRFQTKLLSLIQDKEIGDETWFEDLSTCFSQSQLLTKELPSDFFSRGVDGYDSLDFSQKLRVLNFLCDEALGTESMRLYISEQNDIFFEKETEAKGKVSAAKSKEENHKQQLKGEVAKAITAGDNAASTSDHESIVSRLKSEAAQAHAELLEAQALVQKMKQRSDAFRTQPYLFDADGRAFWKLKGYNNDGDDVLLQDIGTWDALASSDEKWFLYGAETKEAVEKYCSSVRTNRRRTRSMSQTLPSSSGSKEEDILERASPESKEEDILRSADD